MSALESWKYGVVCVRTNHSLKILHGLHAQLLTTRLWIPATFIFFAVAVFVVTCIGFKSFKHDDATASHTWLPRNDQLLQQRKEYLGHYGQRREERYLFVADTSINNNVITQDFFLGIYRLHQYVTTQLSVTVHGRTYYYRDLCHKVQTMDQEGCFEINPLAFWGVGIAHYNSPTEVPTSLAQPNRTKDNPWSKLDLVVGKITEQREDAIIIAESVQLWYYLMSSSKNIPNYQEVAVAFERKLESVIDSNYTIPHTHAYVYTMSTFRRELAESIENDNAFFAAIAAIVFLLCLSFVSFDFINKSKLLLGMCAAVSICMAMTSTLGITYWADLAPVSVVYCVAFLIGLFGLNHVFLLVHTCDRAIERQQQWQQDRQEQLLQSPRQGTTDASLRHVNIQELLYGQAAEGSIEKQRLSMYREVIETTLKEGMPSVSLSMIFSLAAMFAGLLSPIMLYGSGAGLIPTLSSFTFVAIAGIMFEYFYLNFFFIPILAYDVKRAMHKRADVLFCIKEERHWAKRRERLVRLIVRKGFTRIIALLRLSKIEVLASIWLLALGLYTATDYKFEVVPAAKLCLILIK
eukprot:TRINITY_DN4427_c3_g1_i3.p1 TRINITY_DN4427_c3_g1~~TRINITY_DN4427_c3_g1_i3.p1  ORF type:complete len:577 (+),score=46.22 TRINITY_DN4427_c3_g1_i3:131-1861(+)